MAEQYGAQQRQPANSYPSPHSYPSPQMQPTYTYPPPQGQQSNEPYRQSPTGSSMALPSLSLPPLRAMDGQAQMQAQAQASPSQTGVASTMPPSVQQMPQYYPPPPPHPQQAMGHPGQAMNLSSTAQMMRYPIPAQAADARMLSGGRHKKEIKRRTKTGCLTCRKRRIKCDEQHPVCRNCQKSKRDCLGYDPIFKQQSGQQQQQQQQLQPAQSASPSSTSSTPVATASASFPAHTSTPQGYSPSLSGSYGTGGGSASVPVAVAAQTAFEINSAIDPALAAADVTMSSKIPSIPATGPPAPPTAVTTKPLGRPIQIEDLFNINGQAPYEVPESTNPIPSATLEEIKILYNNDFAPGFDNLLETTWFSTAGLEKLLTNSTICGLMTTLLKYFAQVGAAADQVAEDRVRSLETRALWQILCLSREALASATTPNGAAGSSSTAATTTGVTDVNETVQRLEVLEYLLTNRTLTSNPLLSLTYNEAALTPEKKEEVEFWRLVGNFVSRNADDKMPKGDEQDKTLSLCRDNLNARENRDVIYSIMVTRHIGARVPGFPDNIRGRPGGEEDDNDKVLIAKIFLVEQAQYKGTNHPIQRVCNMAIRSWALR